MHKRRGSKGLDTMSEGRRLVPANGLLVVGVEGVWSVAPAAGRDPIEVEVESLVALVRASNGESTNLPGPLSAALVEVGALVERPVPADDVVAGPKVRAVESPEP